jgi:serine/threonine protein kinase/tetratricopeptide (TPR) repeat protein
MEEELVSSEQGLPNAQVLATTAALLRPPMLLRSPEANDINIFTDALQLPAAERDAFLEHACEDGELRVRMKALLHAHDLAGNFFEHPPAKETIEERLGMRSREKPGDRIGRFTLLEQIGEGGCGVVFLAEQEEPIRRRVALKVIKPGMDTEKVIARFSAERQALALMDHPNIAKVFDAGETDSGRPYFVMELVAGIKITEYSDRHSLSTEERLKLFVRVCQAIQHAHQKGIIHRDIKPSNLLVTTSLEGEAVPIVIDFGVAKATAEQQLTDGTLLTAVGFLIGTPAYMSPEQAAISNEDLDTRTDIYSLGVLLYELLTGATPFNIDELLKVGLDEIRRVIREQEPSRPSAALRRIADADLAALAQKRRAAPPTLIRAVCGDLDWIVMKALEKDRKRRYPTAHGLALDIQRHLSREPILARPPSTLYRVEKTVLRNKLLFGGIAVLALLLLAGLVAVSSLLVKERRSRHIAERASIKSQQVTTFLERMLDGVGPSVALGRDTTMLREILDETARRIGTEIIDQPTVESELRDLIGRLYHQTGNYKEAEAMHRVALTINQKVFGSESAAAAASLNDLGVVLMAVGKLSEAEDANRQALSIRRKLFGENNADTATSLNSLANVYRQTRRTKEAEIMAREALATRCQLFGERNLQVADSLRNLSIIMGDAGKWSESEIMAREVLRLRRELLGDEHPWVASALNDVGWAVGGLNRLQEAELLEREALAMRQRLLGGEHPDVAKSLYLVGERMRQRGSVTEAHSILHAAFSIQRKLLGEDNPALIDTLKSLALALKATSRWPELEMVYRDALAVWRKQAGPHDPQTLWVARDLASTLEAQGKWQEAEVVHREALGAWRKRSGNDDPQTLYTLDLLGIALEAQSKWEDAVVVYRETLSAWRKRAGDQDSQTLPKWESLARTLCNQGSFAEAGGVISEAIGPNVFTRPECEKMLYLRAGIKARLGEWHGAADDAALAFEHHPGNTRYAMLAALLLKTQDHVGYNRLCERLIVAHARTTHPYTADQVAKACLLRPFVTVDLGIVARLADTAVIGGADDTNGIPFYQLCKALSEYRSGRYKQAVEWAEKSLSVPGVYVHGHAYAVAAMACWQLGQRDKARAMLAKGEELEPPSMPVATARNPSEAWLAWLYARIQLEEATALIGRRVKPKQLPSRSGSGHKRLLSAIHANSPRATQSGL